MMKPPYIIILDKEIQDLTKQLIVKGDKGTTLNHFISKRDIENRIFYKMTTMIIEISRKRFWLDKTQPN